ncbi:MAG: hypothetical protein AAGC44_13695 [Planctomycetota bacterium]
MTDPEDALRDLAAASASGDEPIEPEPVKRPEAPAGSGRPESPISKRRDAPPAVERDVSEMSANALAQLSGSGSAAYDPAARSASGRRKRRAAKPDTGAIGIKIASIPVLVTMGLAMLALGVWGILIKAGNTTLPLADLANAQQLAILGMVGLPIGLLLLASAGFMFYIVGKEKQKLARWEAKQREGNK